MSFREKPRTLKFSLIVVIQGCFRANFSSRQNQGTVLGQRSSFRVAFAAFRATLLGLVFRAASFRVELGRRGRLLGAGATCFRVHRPFQATSPSYSRMNYSQQYGPIDDSNRLHYKQILLQVSYTYYRVTTTSAASSSVDRHDSTPKHILEQAWMQPSPFLYHSKDGLEDLPEVKWFGSTE